jgi:hypothetical protein
MTNVQIAEGLVLFQSRLPAGEQRELAMPIHAGSGVTFSKPLVNQWRSIRIRPLDRGPDAR